MVKEVHRDRDANCTEGYDYPKFTINVCIGGRSRRYRRYNRRHRTSPSQAHSRLVINSIRPPILCDGGHRFALWAKMPMRPVGIPRAFHPLPS